MHAHAIPVSSDPRSPLPPDQHVGQPQRASAVSPLWAGRRGGWVLIQLATAALLLLTLGLGYLALRPDTPLRHHLAALSALETSATPTVDEQGTRTLAAITLPTGMMPSEVLGGLNHYTIPAGTTSGTASTWVATCCRGPRFEYIVSGSFTVRSAGPVQVLHGASTWETQPAGTEVSVTAGDAVLLRMEDAFDAANTSTVPVELVEAVLFEGQVADDPIPYGWDYHDQDIWRTKVSVPPGPTTLRLQQTTLAPGANLSRPVDAVMQLAVSLEQGASLTTRLAVGHLFDVQNVGPTPVVAYVLTVEPTGEAVPAGSPAP